MQILPHFKEGELKESLCLQKEEGKVFWFFVLVSFILTCGGGLVTKSCLTLVTPWTVASQAPLPMGFSRQEYWSGLPFPSPGDLPNPGIKPESPALQANSEQILPTEL